MGGKLGLICLEASVWSSIFTPRGVVGAVPIRRGLCHIGYIEALSSHVSENGEPLTRLHYDIGGEHDYRGGLSALRKEG